MSGGLEVHRTAAAGRDEATAEFGMAGAWHMAVEWDGPAGLTLDDAISRALQREPSLRFTPSASGEIGFACGTDMLRGTVVVQH